MALDPKQRPTAWLSLWPVVQAATLALGLVGGCAVDVSSACTSDNDCLRYEFCHEGACSPPQPVGGTCGGLAWHCLGDAVCRDNICEVGQRPCVTSDDCPLGEPICGPDPSPLCQAGRLGDPCDSDRHCAGASPFCAPAGVCQEGIAGDPCEAAPADGELDCRQGLFCSSGLRCTAGRAGDTCDGLADCRAPTGRCGPGGPDEASCQPGWTGDPCDPEAEPSHCDTDAGFHCVYVEAEGAYRCHDGSAGDPCASDSDCSPLAGECGPEGGCQPGSEGGGCAGDADCAHAQLLCSTAGRCQDGSPGDSCAIDDDCAGYSPLCGPDGACQPGHEGDACDSDQDCHEALVCSYLGRCQDGSATDPCASDADCLDPTPICGPAGCQYGGLGQPCDDPVHCGPGSPFCGPEGCQEGREGDPCDADGPADCPDICSSAGVCQDGSAGDACQHAGDCGVGTAICGPFGCQAGLETDPCRDPDECADTAPICGFSGRCQDGDAGDACVEAAECVGLDCLSQACCTPEGLFASWRPIVLYEPCREPSPAFRAGACATAEQAYADAGSSWRRTDEPVEIALVSGILDESVTAHWTFDGDLADNTAHGHDAVGTDVVFRPGRAGASPAAYFWSGGFAEVPDAPDLSGMSALTVCAWMSPHCDTSVAGCRLVSKERVDDADPATSSFGLGLTHVANGHHPTFAVSTSSGEVVVPSAGEPSLALPIFEWVHVCGTYDGAAVRLFTDGRLVAEAPWMGPVNVTSDPLRIGRCYSMDATCASQPFKGDVDELFILDRALSHAEVRAHYASGRPFGESLVPDAQADFDDVRVSVIGADGRPSRLMAEIVGPRPHGDQGLDDLLAYWPVDGDAQDRLGGADGSLMADVTPVLGRFGDSGGALRFDGASHVTTPFVLNLGAADALTLEAWVRHDGFPATDNAVLLGADEALLGQVVLSVRYPGAQVAVDLRDANGVATSAVSLADVADGAWHHVAAVRDPVAGQVRLYVDGRLEATEPDATADIAPGRPVYLGANNDGEQPRHYLRGDLDEVLVHARALSGDEVAGRARPALPTLRFLASTAATANAEGHYEFPDYRLHWESSDAERLLPLVADPEGGPSCRSLLSTCQGYVGWWRFDRLVGGIVEDSSSNRLDGNVFGAPSLVAGLDGRGLALDGLADYVVVPDHPLLDLSRFTVEAWARRTSGGSTQALVTRGGGAADVDYSLGFEADDRLFTRFDEPGVGPRSVTSAAAQPLEVWTHAAGTFDAGQLAVYVDHGLVGAVAGGNGPAPGEGGLWLGAAAHSEGGAESVFEGTIDSVRVMRRALPADEMLQAPPAAVAFGAVSPGHACLLGCQSDAFCGSDAAICGPSGLCQPGIEGDPCETAADCADRRLCSGVCCQEPIELLVNGDFEDDITVGWFEEFQEGEVTMVSLPGHPTAVRLNSLEGENRYIRYYQDIDVTGIDVAHLEDLVLQWDWRVDEMRAPYGLALMTLYLYDDTRTPIASYIKQRTAGWANYACASRRAEATIPLVCVDETDTYVLGEWSGSRVPLRDLLDGWEPDVDLADVATIRVWIWSYNNAGTGVDLYLDDVSLSYQPSCGRVDWPGVDFADWRAPVPNPVMSAGFSGGSFDAGGVGRAFVRFDEESAQYQGWYTGYETAERLRASIGLATSPDGLDWVPHSPEPVIGSGDCDDNPNSQTDHSPVVLKDANTYRLWYSSDYLSRTFTCLSESTDGANWVSRGVVIDWVAALGDIDHPARYVFPVTVTRVGETYHMWYNTSFGPTSTIGYATSPDGVDWEVHGDVLDSLGDGAWDGYELQWPAVLRLGSTWHMFYVGREGSRGATGIGLATSDDGLTWTRSPDNPLIVEVPGWYEGGFERPMVLLEHEDTLRLWVSGDDGLGWGVGMLELEAAGRR